MISLFSTKLALLRAFFVRGIYTLTYALLASQALLIAHAQTPNNTLANHPSPYLAMHSDDPVHWQTWQSDTLIKAQHQSRLILVSSGYFACHWCHVMQHENYQNTDTANYLNAHYLSIKIDRELSPDLDKYLVDFSQRSRGTAGWPQHVIFTPQGYPIFAFTYLDNVQFKELLVKLNLFWQDSPKKLQQLAKKAIDDIPIISTASLPYSKEALIATLNQQLPSTIDTLSGGLKTSTKFPNAPLLKTVLLQIKQTLASNVSLTDNQIELSEWLQLTLDQMQSPENHLFDHVNGGFYRYTIDPEWQTPHFEKMLYTQAQLAEIYLIASQVYQRNDYLNTAVRTLDYTLKHLYNPDTKLYLSSQSALNKAGEEGGNYLFSIAQLKAKTTPSQFKELATAWKLNDPAPYPTGWHPTPLTKAHHWKAIQTNLLTSPNAIPTDEKSLVGWNGLLLSAFTQANQIIKDKPYQVQANQLAKRLTAILTRSNPPRALSLTGGDMSQANIQDYAFVIQGLRDVNRLQKHPAPTNQTFISNLIDQATHAFYTKKGWLMSDAPLLPGQIGEAAMPDSAMPSPTSILDCGNTVHLEKATRQIAHDLFNHASYLSSQCEQGS